ncbi:MAG: hypothetical protein HRU77_01595 [Gammaproteobacteria bacterium]|nr:MAG: hypothetical protein HRU77_01595 [Gammaproteobacteria bacterium]
MNRPLYIFDIDGTLAIINHRVSILEDKDNPNRWRDFYAACDRDEPNKPVIFIMNNLMLSGADVWLFSGRSEEVRDKTVAWIAEHTAFMSFNLNYEHLLTMRPAMDYTPDDVLKESWLDNMLEDDKKRLVAVFDDRDRVVNMWRRRGITCLQVAPGDF